MIKKSEMTLSCQTLLPIIKTDENFDYFTKDIHRHHFFSSLITSSDFSRVMSILQRLSLKKQPVSCIFHLRQHQKPSMLVLLNGTYHNHHLNITIYDIATLDETRLREITYHKLHFSDEYLLKEKFI